MNFVTKQQHGARDRSFSFFLKVYLQYASTSFLNCILFGEPINKLIYCEFKSSLQNKSQRHIKCAACKEIC